MLLDRCMSCPGEEAHGLFCPELDACVANQTWPDLGRENRPCRVASGAATITIEIPVVLTADAILVAVLASYTLHA